MTSRWWVFVCGSAMGCDLFLKDPSYATEYVPSETSDADADVDTDTDLDTDTDTDAPHSGPATSESAVPHSVGPHTAAPHSAAPGHSGAR